MVGFWIFLITLAICATILGGIIIYEKYENIADLDEYHYKDIKRDLNEIHGLLEKGSN